MAYEYDNDNGFRPERPQPPKKDNDKQTARSTTLRQFWLKRAPK